MELIPILSTIVLVATLVTLLLSVSAYIVYKVKERKVNGVANGHSRYKEPSPSSRPISVPELGRRSFVPSVAVPGQIENPVAPPASRIFQTPPPAPQPQGVQNPVPEESGTEQGMGFFIYTPYGYVPVKSTKTEGKLRWR